MATVTIYQTDGTKTVTEREANNPPTLEELQAHVGGYIESVDRFLEEGTRAYANEDGLFKGLRVNLVATVAVKWPYPIVGPVVVITGFNEED